MSPWYTNQNLVYRFGCRRRYAGRGNAEAAEYLFLTLFPLFGWLGQQLVQKLQGDGHVALRRRR